MALTFPSNGGLMRVTYVDEISGNLLQVAAEMGNPTFLLTNGQLLSRMEAASGNVVATVKEQSTAVVS